MRLPSGSVQQAPWILKRPKSGRNTQVVQKLRSGVTQLLKKNKVTIVFGDAKFTSKSSLAVTFEGKTEDYTFKNAILAVGSRPIEIKAAPFSKRIVDSTGILNTLLLTENLKRHRRRLHRL